MYIHDAINELKQRKHGREIQGARYGISADPVVLIEIQDLTKVIAALNSIHEEYTTTKKLDADRVKKVIAFCQQHGFYVGSIEMEKVEL